jgi:TPR repeat protein
MKIKAILLVLFFALFMALGCATTVDEPPTPPAPPIEPVVDPVAIFEEAKVRAEQGSAIDQDNLGRLYLEGTGVEQDDVEAANWARASAEAGYAPAQRGFAALLTEGRGVPQDFGEALKWLHKAAEQGDALAQERLASAYWRGIGTERRDAEAYAWSNVAAANGLDSAAGLRDFIAKYLTTEEVEEAQELARDYFKKYKTPMGENADPSTPQVDEAEME